MRVSGRGPTKGGGKGEGKEECRQKHRQGGEEGRVASQRVATTRNTNKTKTNKKQAKKKTGKGKKVSVQQEIPEKDESNDDNEAPKRQWTMKGKQRYRRNGLSAGGVKFYEKISHL